METPPNLIPYFWRNAAHHPQLESWFGIEEAAYRAIALRFLKPSAKVDSMRRAWLAKYASTPNVYRLGIHLRWGADHRPQPVRDDEWTDMVECAHAVVPSHFLESSAAPSAEPSLLIFVAADTPESRQRALQTLSARLPRARILFYENWLRSNTPEGVQAALTELLLLAECDTLVLTPHSSYGEQAMVLHGKPGYIVRSTVPNPARVQYTVTHEVRQNCLRPYSIQPTIEGFSRDIQRARCYHPDMQAISF